MQTKLVRARDYNENIDPQAGNLTILDPQKQLMMWQKGDGWPGSKILFHLHYQQMARLVYMITDQTSTGAFDVKLFAYDTSNGAKKMGIRSMEIYT